LSQQDVYKANQTNRAVIGLAGEAMVNLKPNSSCKLMVSGKCAILANAGNTPVPVGAQVYLDPQVGYHSLFKNITTQTRNGVISTNTWYSRLVKTLNVGKDPIGLAVNSSNAVQGYNCSAPATAALLCGVGLGDGGAATPIPFCLEMELWVNRTDAPIPGSKVGDEIVISWQFPPNDEVLFGDAYGGAYHYEINELMFTWETVPESMVDPATPINYITYVDDRQPMIGTLTSIDTVVPPLPCSAVHMSYIAVANESALNANFLQLMPPPGVPLYPSGGTNLGTYGIERLIYSVNDSDTSVIGFTQDTREEIVINALRALGLDPDQDLYQLSWCHAANHENYITGISFGGPISLFEKRFIGKVQTQCNVNNQFFCYIYFRCHGQL
jgi:hypothetical protein